MKPIEKTERFTLKKMVIEHLKQYIIEHEIGPGEKLPPERELIKILNVSRSVIREALSYLENTGVLSIRQGQGIFVKPHDLTPLLEQMMFVWKIENKKINELLDLRLLFELTAIGEIIRNGNEADLNELEKIATKMDDPNQNTEWIQNADIDFHRALIKATHNELFIQITHLIVEYFSKVPHHQMTSANIEKTVNEHKDIVQALRENDEKKAKDILSEHLNWSKQNVINVNDNI
jgi:GntR family transcriptional regulator, transcriptional repressor for pyruvate dehydrogenase complex